MKCINKTPFYSHPMDMVNEEPKDYETCNAEMDEVGETGGVMQWANDEGYGSRPIKLYQCPRCKTIKLN